MAVHNEGVQNELKTSINAARDDIRLLKENSQQPMKFKGASSLSSRAKLIFGLFIVLVIAMSWVGSTQMGKSAYAGNFKAPFFLVWFGTSWMIVIFPISVPFYFLANRKLPTCSGLLELWRYMYI